MKHVFIVVILGANFAFAFEGPYTCKTSVGAPDFSARYFSAQSSDLYLARDNVLTACENAYDPQSPLARTPGQWVRECNANVHCEDLFGRPVGGR